MRKLFPRGIPAYSIDDSDAITRELLAIRLEDGTYRRSLSVEESQFLVATPLRCAIDYRYFANRFAVVDDQGHGLRKLSTFSESQAFVLNKVAELEKKRWGVHPDGLLFNVLKARQLFVSTLSETMLAHRILFQPHTRALCGADVEEQAGYLFRMVVRLYDNLPWFLQPHPRFPFVKNREFGLGNSSFLKVAWGKSTRGALQSVTGTEGSKGAMGRPDLWHGPPLGAADLGQPGSDRQRSPPGDPLAPRHPGDLRGDRGVCRRLVAPALPRE